MAYTQDNRLIAVDTPLGKDALLLHSFTGREGISQLFTFDLDLLSENSSISFDQIIGKQVTIHVILAEDTERYFNGFVSRFAQSRSDERFARYRAEVVPWLWFLTRTMDCRIFQNKTIPEIITSIFDELGFTDYKKQLEGTYEPRDYCVQYRETDFNFVSRLMEQYGIFYFFEHEKDKHTLVLGDSPSANKPCPKQSSATYDEITGGRADDDVVTAWEMEQELRPGKYAMTDYNFETPSTSLAVNIDSSVNVGGNMAYEVYDYPGEYLKKPQGENLAKIRIEEEEATHFLIRGSSNCRDFTSGYRFDLKGHYRKDSNKSYLLVDIQHMGTVGESYSSGGERAGEIYSNSFTCIPYSVPYRPRRITPRPVVQGTQTAVVVGPPGEEIYTDKYGRVKVQFHWDREGKRDEKSSCWIRVSSPWAGKGWGGVSIPRTGQEVIVDFFEGDPDQPIITGRVYNAEQMPPYALPANATQSGMLSRSSKGGGGADGNEIRLEDSKGKEELYIHGQKDLVIEAENLVSSAVGYPDPYPFPKPGAGCRKVTVKQDEILIVKVGNRETTIETGNETKTISSGKQTNTIATDQTTKVGANQSLSVSGNQSVTVGGNQTVSAGGSRKLTISGSDTVEVSGSRTITAGSSISISAGSEIKLSVGGSTITIGPSGISISAATVDVTGSGPVTIKGAVVKVNS